MSFVIAVWSMSKGFAGLLRGLGRIHGNAEGRNNLMGRLVALGLGVATVVLVIVVLLSVIVGPLLGFEELLPKGGSFLLDLWSVVRWPVLTAAAVAWIAVLLSAGPGTGVRWKEALPGAVVATLGWAVVTLGLELYLQLSSGANPLFRSLGSIIVALYWLYLLIGALLIGGAVNAVRLSETDTKTEASTLPVP